MKKIINIVPFLLFAFLLDRFFFLPGRMDRLWQYESGDYIAEIIAYDDITIINNFEIKISKSQKFDSFYLLGCYFGNLFLLEKQSLRYTTYSALEKQEFTTH